MLKPTDGGMIAMGKIVFSSQFPRGEGIPHRATWESTRLVRRQREWDKMWAGAFIREFHRKGWQGRMGKLRTG